MFGKKKKPEPRSNAGKGSHLMANMGMDFDYGNLNAMPLNVEDGMDDDADFEAELLALEGGHQMPERPKRTKIRAPAAPLMDIDKIGEIDDVDNDEVDENDPELNAELMGLVCDDSPALPSPPKRVTQVTATTAPVAQQMPAAPTQQSMATVLSERIQMYEQAITFAQQNNDSSKARRYTRGLKTLKDLYKQAQAGKPIPEDDIPPPVHTGAQSTVPQKVESTPMPTPRPLPPAPTPQATPQPSTSKDEYSVLTTRRDGYKYAALQAKNMGDIETAKKHFRVAKQFDAVIAAFEAGNPVDLSQMPPPAPTMIQPTAQPRKQAPPPPTTARESVQAAGALEPKSSLSPVEELDSRMKMYLQITQKAKEEGNSSKARRHDRIVKQYQDAIKSFKAGKPVEWESLPTPPGYEPFPPGGPSSSPAKPPPSPQPAGGSAAAAAAPATSLGVPKSQAPQPPSPRSRSPQPPKLVSKHQETLDFIIERQKQYKQAALKAKQAGEIDKAREHLRTAKGFDPMIESLQQGLRVDMKDVPPPPGFDEEKLQSYEFVEHGDCTEPIGDREEMYRTLEQHMLRQIRICTDNAHHFTQIGDLSSAKNFDKMAQNSRLDLDSLKNAYQHDDPVPRFHYETKEFSIVQSCTDLGDNDVDIVIVRGINYNIPDGYSDDQLDTYVKFEFPFPTDEHQEGKTETVRGAISPEYNFSAKLPISRKSRALLRIVKIKSLKLEVWYKRGFLKSDKILGTANIKLAGLEEKCVLHESLDLMEGRRPCGGRLEVKVRIREPFTSKQVEVNKEKWLVIDQITRSSNSSSVLSSSSSSNLADKASMEVLKYERKLLDEKIAKYEKQLTPAQLKTLHQKSQELEKKVNDTISELKAGGKDAYLSYVSAIEKSVNNYHKEAMDHMRKGNKDKAQISLTKKKLVEKEVEAIRSKVS